MVLGKNKAQAGFTLVELLAVMAILGMLAGLVAGTVVGLGTRSQSARLDGDRDGIRKAANAFFLDSFPEAYPVDSTEGTVPSIKAIDFKAWTPQDPNKTFVPDFLTEILDSAALVSWRIDEDSGNVFFAQDGAPLIKPSNNRMDISAVTTSVSGTASSYLFDLEMAKNEAAPEIIEISIPAGYSIGGGQAVVGSYVGIVSVELDTDNSIDPGSTIHFGGVVVATGTSKEWVIVMDYNDNVTSGGSTDISVKTGSEATRKHILDVVAPSSSSGGTSTITLERGTDTEENLATETWEITMFGTATRDISSVLTIPTTGTSAGGGAGIDIMTISTSGAIEAGSGGSTLSPTLTMIVNPSTGAVYRWSVEEHTTISPTVGTTDFFGNMPGTQGVLIN